MSTSKEADEKIKAIYLPYRWAMKHVAVLIALAILLGPQSVRPQGRCYLRTEYLYSMATCLAEHADGTMWIGTPGGLFRYNGYYYNFYYSDTTATCLPNNYINSLYVDPSGRT